MGRRPHRSCALFLNHISPFRDVELELGSRNVFVDLDPIEQDVGALADAIYQLHVIDFAAAKGQAQAIKQGVFGFWLKREVHDFAR